MAPTSEQRIRALSGPCFALRFLIFPDCRNPARQQMEGFSDSAIFHRWMDLCWTFGDPQCVALLSAEENVHLKEFSAALESLIWRPMESHPFISELADDDLSTLLPSAMQLLKSLESPSFSEL